MAEWDLSIWKERNASLAVTGDGERRAKMGFKATIEFSGENETLSHSLHLHFDLLC
jgi:hypothetical protein